MDPLQQYHTGWSIFADEGQEGAGSASSSQAPPQQQAAAAGSGGPRGGTQHHQQHQQQQPYLPSHQPMEHWLVANTPSPTTASATTTTTGERLCRAGTGDMGLCSYRSTIQWAVETEICPGL